MEFFKIERAFSTLFGALKLQSQGELPRLMLKTVQPTFDLNLYAKASWEARTRHVPNGGAIPLVLGDVTTWTVDRPTLVLAVSLELNAFIAGDGGMIQLRWQRPQITTGPFTLLSLHVPITTAANIGQYSSEQVLGQAFWAAPQTVFTLNCSRVDGVPDGRAQILMYQPDL